MLLSMKVMVTAGPTREFIDPVRFLSNRSTGKMGYAIAAALLERGHDVLLVTGPVSLQPPAGARVCNVVSADDMLQAVTAQIGPCDAVIMSAAVADWRPSSMATAKLKKGAGALNLELQPTVDILRAISSLKGNRILAGFAAETGNPSAEARRKLRDKGLDVIFGNDVCAEGSGFESDTNQIFCISADGGEQIWPLMSKIDAGMKIAEIIEALCEGRHV